MVAVNKSTNALEKSVNTPTDKRASRGTGMNIEQANALAQYVNENDRRFRASVLQLPARCLERATSSGNNAFVLLSNRNTGGNPPLIGGLHDYAEALRQHHKDQEALHRFEQWQTEQLQ